MQLKLPSEITMRKPVYVLLKGRTNVITLSSMLKEGECNVLDLAYSISIYVCIILNLSVCFLCLKEGYETQPRECKVWYGKIKNSN